jgi:predicted lysophospholipase L1 biosynthesis ABC-type transport system permease subunit
VIDLPAGLHGRPPLRVDETWYRSGTSTTVAVGADRQSIVLSELVLLASEALIVKCVWELLRARRRDLATLRALGWGRRQAGGQLLADFGLTALAAALAAVLAVGVVGTVLVGRPTWAWLLSMPAAIAMISAAAWWPLLRATVGGLAGRGHDRPAAPVPALLGVFVIALAGAALSLELAVRWAFRDAVQSWAGRSISWQGTLVDVAAVLVIVTMATVTVADLDPAGLRERAAEARTLRAIGWSARDLTWLRVRRAVRLGLAGGGVAGALVLLGGQVAASAAPPRLIGVAGLAAVAGVAMSLLAAGLSTIFGRPRDDANN